MTFYHINEKFKVFDSKPVYEAYQPTIAVKVKDAAETAAVNNDARVSGTSNIRPCSIREFSLEIPGHKMMIDILGVDMIFYQR